MHRSLPSFLLSRGLEELALEEAEMHAAATKIQTVFKGRRARRKMEARRGELRELEAEAEKVRKQAESNAAAQRISNVMRAFVAFRKVVKRKRENAARLAELEGAGDASVKEIEEMKGRMQAEIRAMEMQASLQSARDRKDLDVKDREFKDALEKEQR